MATPFRTTRRVEFRDTDAAGIAHFSVFFKYMEEAEHALWRSLGMSVKHVVDGQAISWPRVSAKCDYHSAVRFEDVLQIEVRIARLGEKSVTFDFRITCDDRLVASGQMTAVHCRFPPHAPPESVAIPDEIRQKLLPLAS
jgi:4-hydroxybenzoyl-CoA thioesterase/acyl-CoA thioester hydrolase